jgi:energy-coupling factor transporter transmembrane protein EcfT
MFDTLVCFQCTFVCMSGFTHSINRCFLIVICMCICVYAIARCTVYLLCSLFIIVCLFFFSSKLFFISSSIQLLLFIYTCVSFHFAKKRFFSSKNSTNKWIKVYQVKKKHWTNELDFQFKIFYFALNFSLFIKYANEF